MNKEALIAVGKPHTQDFKEKQSESHGGISLRVRALLVENGMIDPRQIRAELGISSSAMGSTRRTLKGWGIELPRVRASYTEFKAEVSNADDNKKLQEILANLSDGQILGYLNHYGGAEDAVLITIARIARNAGLNFGTNSERTKKAIKRLKNAKIPIRSVEKRNKGKLLGHYWVSFAKCEPKILQVLRNKSNRQVRNFQQPPVKI